MAKRPQQHRVSVTIDTNLIVSAMIRKRGNPYALFLEWLAGAFRHVTSPFQIAELERALNRDKIKHKHGLTSSEITDVLTVVRRAGRVVTPLSPLPLEVRDANDEPILGRALAGQADYLVTGDLDLLSLRDDPRIGNLKIVTVREFLGCLENE